VHYFNRMASMVKLYGNIGVDDHERFFGVWSASNVNCFMQFLTKICTHPTVVYYRNHNSQTSPLIAIAFLRFWQIASMFLFFRFYNSLQCKSFGLASNTRPVVPGFSIYALPRNHVRWVPLSPQYGVSSGCGWKGRPPVGG
jgi:hypothetical protein